MDREGRTEDNGDDHVSRLDILCGLGGLGKMEGKVEREEQE